ncbi:hypothetical protein TNCV_1677721 [Trichonephila clavipes]|nr:hypothetical protein TNCV_1677721 [Trichonephila clavipes]
MLKVSIAQTSLRWYGEVVRRGGASSGIILFARSWFKITRAIAKSSRVAEQCDVNIYSPTHQSYSSSTEVTRILRLSVAALYKYPGL